jgi:hypothetical protein
MLSPDGCFPTVTVPMALGGLALRSMMWTFVGHLLQALAILDHIDGVGDERDRAGGIDGEVDRRPDHRVLQRKIGHDLWVHRVDKIDDQDGIVTGKRQQRLKLIVPQTLLVIADDHEWRGLRKRETTGQAGGGREHPQHGVEGHAISHAVFARVSAFKNANGRGARKSLGRT